MRWLTAKDEFGKKPLSEEARKWMAGVPSVGLEYVLKDKSLAIQLLLSRHKNLVCLYHSHVTKTGKVKSIYHDCVLTGIEKPRNFNNKKTAQEGIYVQRPAGYLHCGCPEDHALMELVVWKLMRVYRRGNSEGMRNMVLDPRQRLFMMEMVTFFSGIVVDDLFAYDPKGNLRHHEDFRVRMCESIIQAGEKGKEQRLNNLAKLE
jgi:hypothetical protein